MHVKAKRQFHTADVVLPGRSPWFQLGRRVGRPQVRSEYGVKEEHRRF
jgi:hypothetical protein